MFTNDKITEIFYVVHEFCNAFEKAMSGHIVRKDNVCIPEIVLLNCMIASYYHLILFHAGQFRNLNTFIPNTFKFTLPLSSKTVSYNRFVELQSKSCNAISRFPKDLLFRKMHGHIFY